MGQILGGLFRILTTMYRPSMRQQELDSNSSQRDLTDNQIEELAKVIVAKYMATITITYLGLLSETVENLRSIRLGDYMGFNRDILSLWRNKNRGVNQVQKLADILYAAAEDGGLVDPHKIEEILKVSNTRNSTTGTSMAEETITEAEFLTIAEKLKPHVERRMKIEPFPWLRDYYVDMRELYTKLTLEKMKNTLFGEKRTSILHYEEMFERGSNSDRETEKKYSEDEGHLQINRLERDKILMKGDPGMGKTTLGKKMGLDWAEGLFEKYSIVFFVHLKFVKPGDSIESAIIQQHTELRGLKVSERKLRAVLERFGDRCLLILDGLDEHGLGKNEDVLRIIRGEKLLDCGIVVSSRPHFINEVKLHFPTIVRVDGFTENEASKFVSNFFTERQKISEIIKFKPSDSRDFPVHKCPILLSILCLLVKEDEINLSKEDLTVGDLYLRMGQCLYKIFTIRKGVQFEKNKFIEVMKSVGKLALQTLITKNPLLQKSEVLGIVGEFAFEYGFFAGHEDFRLCTDTTADIYVTYVHRSMEEFFGSFGFIQDLDDGQTVDDILGSDCKEPIFMVNPLVLNFCLWSLSREYLESSKHIYDRLTSYVAKRIDHYELNIDTFRNCFPAINIGNPNPDNKLLLKFFNDVFKKCVYIRVLYVSIDSFYLTDELTVRNQFDTTLGRLSPNILAKLTVLAISEDLTITPGVKIDHRANFSIVIGTHNTHNSLQLLKLLLTKYNLLKRNPHVYLTGTDISTTSRDDLTPLMTKQIKELRLDRLNSDSKQRSTLFASGEFPFCPQFTHFIAKDFRIDDSVPSAFMKAVHVGNLPNLKRIELNGCTLSDCQWPEVPEFCLWPKIAFDTSQMQKLVSSLTKLTLDSFSDVDHRISTHLTKLSILKLNKARVSSLSHLNDILRERILPNLTALLVYASGDKEGRNRGRFLNEFDLEHSEKLEKLSLQGFITSSQELKILCQKRHYLQLHKLNLSNSHNMTGSLSVIFTHSFPTLNTLILSYCGLNANDLQSLARANVDGKLPQLRHLDISGNRHVKISDLFTNSAQLNELTTLGTADLTVLNIEPWFLTSMKELTLQTSKWCEAIELTRSWPRLLKLQLDVNKSEIYRQIADGVERGLFPVLETISYSGDDISASDLFILYRATIYIENYY